MLRAAKSLFVLLSTCTLVAAIVVIAPTGASAASGNILAPFPVGQTWNICQGYDSRHTHNGTSRYGVDLTGAGCDSSAAGRTVVAPRAGTVAYWQPAYGNLCVNFSGGSYTLTHIAARVTSGNVRAGQSVGTVARSGAAGNGGVAHIHFQMWSKPNCYNNAPIPLDAAHKARICGAPNLAAAGPAGTGNGTWSGTRFRAQACGTPASGGHWERVGGSMRQLDLGPQGQLWAVNAGGVIHQYAGSGRWIARGKGFAHVTVGKAVDNGPFVYAIKTDGSVVRWTAGRWSRIGGGMRQLDLGPQGQLWAVSRTNRIYQYAGKGKWTGHGSGYKSVTVGRVADNGPFVYAIKTDNSIVRYQQNYWAAIPGKFVQAELGPQGQLWAISPSSMIYQYAGKGKWVARGSGYRHVTVGKPVDKGPVVYATRTDNSIVRWRP